MVKRRSPQADKDRYARMTARSAQIYGGQCEWCASTRSLEFDHVNGDGDEHRKAESSVSMKRRIVRTGRRLDDVSLRLLCAPCHKPIWRYSRHRLQLLMASSNDWPVLL